VRHGLRPSVSRLNRLIELEAGGGVVGDGMLAGKDPAAPWSCALIADVVGSVESATCPRIGETGQAV
jgi:hypothetical protein